MTGIPVTGANAWHDLEPRLVFDRPKSIERRDGVGLGVDRVYLGSAARCIAPVEGGDLRLPECFLHRASI